MKQWISRDTGSDRLPVETLVRIDQLKLLYRQSFAAVYVSLIVGGMLTLILWINLRSVEALVWLALLAVSTLFRFALFALYWVRRPSDEAVLKWKTPYLVTLVISSLIWGVGVLWVMPSDIFFYQVICFLFLMGMAGGALSAYYAVRGFTILTLFVIMVPIIAWMLMTGELTAQLLGLAATVYLLSAVRATYVLSSALQQSFLLTHELTLAKEMAEDLARTDPLTGLPNRRAFTEAAQQAVTQCQRAGQSVTMILIDIDHFKKLNDTLGHATGDIALQQVARVIEETIRDSDICARLGGEEFVVFMPHTSLEGGLTVAEKLRQAIEMKDLGEVGVNARLTASLGLAWGKSGDTDEFIARADKAMYRAKQSGRNRVCS